VRKIASITGKETAPKEKPNPTPAFTCQFCKHRLAYIDTAKGPNIQEDFYHKCELRNCSVTLNETCPLFEEDNKVF